MTASNNKSTEHEYIYKRFETLRNQIERDYFNLLSQASQIEAEIVSSRTSSDDQENENYNDDDDDNDDNIDPYFDEDIDEPPNSKSTGRVLTELGNFKSNLALVQNNLEREKFYLFKSFQGLNDASSRSLIASLGDSVERLLFDKHTEFDSIENRLNEMVQQWCQQQQQLRRRRQRRRRRKLPLPQSQQLSYANDDDANGRIRSRSWNNTNGHQVEISF